MSSKHTRLLSAVSLFAGLSAFSCRAAPAPETIAPPPADALVFSATGACDPVESFSQSDLVTTKDHVKFVIRNCRAGFGTQAAKKDTGALIFNAVGLCTPVTVAPQGDGEVRVIVQHCQLRQP